MSKLRTRVPSGVKPPGGIAGYPLDKLSEEVAYVAYHFHWPLGDIVRLSHADRRNWVEEIGRINQRMKAEYLPG